MEKKYSKKDNFSEDFAKYDSLFHEVKNNGFDDDFSWYACDYILNDSKKYIQNCGGLLIPKDSKLENLILDIITHKDKIENNISKDK